MSAPQRERAPARGPLVRAGAGPRRGALIAALAASLLAACCPPAVAPGGAATSAVPPTATPTAETVTDVAVSAARPAGRDDVRWASNGGHAYALLGQAGDGSGDRGGDGSRTSSGAAGEVDLAARFESAWRLVAERYWDLGGLEVDWDEVGERYRAKLPDVAGPNELYALLEEMYAELGDDHSVYVPPARVAEIRDSYGDLPCVAVFDSSALLGPTWAGGLLAQAQEPPTSASGPVEYGLAEDGEISIGYVRLADLASDGVAAGLRDAVRRLASSGADAFVLDLRGNPGGRLVTMMQAAGVFTRGFLWRAVMSWTLPLPYPAIGEPVTDRPLAVLVDGGVNSAAEGLAGALQANDRAVVVGETTAGNVEAVLPFCLRDGSQAWIATGVLAPLLGATWEGRGVVPDVAAPSEDAYAAAVAHLAATVGERD